VTRALRGIGVSPGIACAPAFIVRVDFPEVPDRTVRSDQVDDGLHGGRHVSAAPVTCQLGIEHVAEPVQDHLFPRARDEPTINVEIVVG